jgi:hypothetical protein
MEWQVPTLADVLQARRRISPPLRPTPLFASPALNELLGAEVFVKRENHQLVGAFKVGAFMTTRGDVGTEIAPEHADDPQLAARLDDPAPRLQPRAVPLCRPFRCRPLPPLWGWRGRCSGTARGSGRSSAAKRRLAGRRYVATGTAAAAASIIVTTSSGCETIAT